MGTNSRRAQLLMWHSAACRTVPHNSVRPKQPLVPLNSAKPETGYAFQATQVIQLGAADAGGTQDFNLINHLGVGGENALYSLAEADLAHSKAGLGPGALGNYGAFEGLQAFFIALLDPYVHADGVARGEL